MKLILVFCLLFLLDACNVNDPVKSRSTITRKIQTNNNLNNTIHNPDSLKLIRQRLFIDSTLFQVNLIDVQLLNKDIWIDLKYATEHNFIGKKLYQRIDRAYLQKDVADRLVKCQMFLSEIDSSLHLLIYDALRPVSIQKKMWIALDTIPSYERGKFVSNPANKSLHNYGAAIDLTICDSKGKPIDMGADFDDFREIAYPNKESYYIKTGELSEEHIANRKLLRKVMRSQSFRNLPTEWWHFNACSRSDAQLKYKVLENEP